MGNVSVTKVMAAVGYTYGFGGWRGPAEANPYLQRGRAVHAACEYDDEGTLDEASVTPLVLQFLAGWRRFKQETGCRSFFREQALVHPSLEVVGHPDNISWWAGERVLVDIKTGDGTLDPATIVQLAAYRELWRVNNSKAPIAAARAVHLHSDGTYQVYPIESRALDDGWFDFLAALRVYRWRERHGRLAA